MPPAAAPRPRDRDETAKTILAAARGVLADDGFQGLGINVVARRAGCDKQLIYRYFGGLDGLVEAIGDDLGGWWADNLHLDPQPEGYAELIERFALGLLDALRSDPLVQKIAAWEVAGASPLVARLTEARSRAMVVWFAQARGDLAPPADVDAAAANAVVIAAIQHLVLASAASGEFAGVKLQTEADWDRVRSALKRIVAALY